MVVGYKELIIQFYIMEGDESMGEREREAKSEPVERDAEELPSEADLDADVRDLKVRDLLRIVEAREPSPERLKELLERPRDIAPKPKPDPAPVESGAEAARQVADDRRLVGVRRQEVNERVAAVGPSQRRDQVAFLRGLMENEGEAAKFREDPKAYAVEHGVLLDPQVIQAFTDGVLFDSFISQRAVEVLGPEGVRDLAAVRAVGARANIVAAAAVVVAVAAVVTAVVTVVRTKRPEDLLALKGLGPEGVRIPAASDFSARRVGPSW